MKSDEGIDYSKVLEDEMITSQSDCWKVFGVVFSEFLSILTANKKRPKIVGMTAT